MWQAFAKSNTNFQQTEMQARVMEKFVEPWLHADYANFGHRVDTCTTSGLQKDRLGINFPGQRI